MWDSRRWRLRKLKESRNPQSPTNPLRWLRTKERSSWEKMLPSKMSFASQSKKLTSSGLIVKRKRLKTRRWKDAPSSPKLMKNMLKVAREMMDRMRDGCSCTARLKKGSMLTRLVRLPKIMRKKETEESVPSSLKLMLGALM